MSAAQARLTILAAVLGTIVVFVDSTVVNVALPAISADLGGGIAGQQWLSGAYLLTLGALLLVGGTLGDRYGRRRMFSMGLIGFGVTSLLCAIAPTIETLILARALQGAAGALLVPNTLGLIVAKFPPVQRGAAIGSWTAWAGISTVAGPVVGGMIIDNASWRWIFVINVLPVIAALMIVAKLDAAHDVPQPRHIDVLGATLATLGLAGPVFALIEQPHRGWADPVIFLPLIVGIALLVAFVLVERRERQPMLPLQLFRQRNFAVGNIATLTIYGGLGAAPFFLVLFLQQVADYDALQAGLATLPITLLMFALSKRFGALSDRIGPRLFMAVGPLVGAVGIALYTRMGADADYVTEVLPAVVVFGLGLSLTVAPLTATVLGGVDEHDAGMASAINNAVARIGGLLAVAAIGALVASQLGSDTATLGTVPDRHRGVGLPHGDVGRRRARRAGRHRQRDRHREPAPRRPRLRLPGRRDHRRLGRGRARARLTRATLPADSDHGMRRALALSCALIAMLAVAPAAHARLAWPSTTLQVGLEDVEGGAAALRATAPFGLRYHYLAGGLNSGSTWQSWATGDGSFVTNFIDDSIANGIVPVFSYYELRQSQPGAGQGDEKTAVLTNLANAQTMRAWFEDLKVFFQRAGDDRPARRAAARTRPVGLRAGAGRRRRRQRPGAASPPAGWPSSRDCPTPRPAWPRAWPACATPTRREVRLGYPMSIWGTGKNIAVSDEGDDAIDALSARSIALLHVAERPPSTCSSPRSPTATPAMRSSATAANAA